MTLCNSDYYLGINTNPIDEPTYTDFYDFVMAQDASKELKHRSWVSCAVGQYIETLDNPPEDWRDSFIDTLAEESEDLVVLLDGALQSGLVPTYGALQYYLLNDCAFKSGN